MPAGWCRVETQTTCLINCVKRASAHVEEWEKKIENGQDRPVGLGNDRGFWAHFLTFSPWRPAIPSSLRPGGQCVGNRQACYPPGHRSPCLAADELLCDTSHKANRDPSTRVPRQSSGTPDATLSLLLNLSSSGSRVSRRLPSLVDWENAERACLACVLRANRVSEAGRHAHTLAGGHSDSKAFPTDSTMLQVSSLQLDWLDCIRQLVTTCSAGLLQAFPTPGLASGHHEIALRYVETCSGATVRWLEHPIVSMGILFAKNMFAIKFNIICFFLPASHPMREFLSRSW